MSCRLIRNKNNEVIGAAAPNGKPSVLFDSLIEATGNLNEAGKNLYDYLHQLDKYEYKGIAVAPIPNNDLGKTINDRLKKAIVND